MGHLKLAFDCFMKGYKSISKQLNDIQLQTASEEAKCKSKRFLKLMKSADTIPYLLLLQDILSPLQKLSLALQDKHITAACAASKIELTKQGNLSRFTANTCSNNTVGHIQTIWWSQNA